MIEKILSPKGMNYIWFHLLIKRRLNISVAYLNFTFMITFQYWVGLYAIVSHCVVKVISQKKLPD